MVSVLLILFVAISLAIAVNQQIDKILPPLCMGTVLLIYFISLIAGSLTIAVYLVGAVLLIIVIACILKVRQTSEHGKDSFKSQVWMGLQNNVLTVSVIIVTLTVALECILYTNHRVFHWDDLSYWATYTKTLLAINKIPTGALNCTIDYKDYTPIQQIMQYTVLFFNKAVNEADYFRINTGFMYVLMTPFLGKITKETAKSEILLRTFSYMIFPHLFTTQFYYKLGVDYLIGILFGYLIYVLVEENNAFFRDICIAIGSSYLALLKTSGIVICIFLACFYCVYIYNRTNLFKILSISLVIPALSYFSWILWGIISHNHGYLSDRVYRNVRELRIDLPKYTSEVVCNYLKHFFTYPLTRLSYGISAAAIFLIIILIYHFEKPTFSNLSRRRNLHICMCVGMAVYGMAHIYMYLFVFDEAEAHGLLEFDRYIMQYLGGIFYFYFQRIFTKDAILSRIKNHKAVLTILVIILISVFPYRDFVKYMIPSLYKTEYESEWKPHFDKADMESGRIRDYLRKLNLPPDSVKLGLIADAWEDDTQFLIYNIIPQPITFVYNSPAIEQGMLEEFIESQTIERSIRYIYVSNNSKKAHEEEWDSSTSMLTDNGIPLEEGHLYEAVGDNSSVKLRKMM